ncbi:hypothetical protein [Leucobacter sp. G161]|uniref:hypothetical protein n=1 Tax=Leucobacter sp. G161 TaxID=663704 RepID=UPI00073B1EE2|nr:hypothetical protein [Leucobacter sp. G161]KUF05543.1 hypothetical protein AUL38_04095 [Leucobacter sp. G161]
MLNAVIDVNVEPTRLDELMWQIAVFSALATVFLGGLAWFNGHRATAIADDANKRESRRLEAELKEKVDDARKETALSMIKALLAYKTLGYTPLKAWNGDQELINNPRVSTARQDAELVQAKSLAQISLFESEPEAAARMRDWLDHATSHVYYAFQMNDLSEAEQNLILNDFLSVISGWGSGITTTTQLTRTDTSGLVDTGDEVAWCHGRTFD